VDVPKGWGLGGSKKKGRNRRCGMRRFEQASGGVGVCERKNRG